MDEQNSWRSGEGLPEISILQLDWTRQARISDGREIDKNHTYYWAHEQATIQIMETKGLKVIQYDNLNRLIIDLFGIQKHEISTNHWTEVK